MNARIRYALALVVAVLLASIGRLALAGAAPVVTAVSPGMTPSAGAEVTVSGSGLSNALSVVLGSATIAAHPCAGAAAVACFTATSDNSITLQLGAVPTSTVDVVVTSPLGTSTTSAADELTFFAGAPLVTSVEPARGSTFGGQPVLIHGSNLTPAGGSTIDVDFGSARVPATANPDGTLTAVTPPGAMGSVPVRVVTQSDDGSVGQASAAQGPTFTFGISAQGAEGVALSAFGSSAGLNWPVAAAAMWPGWRVARDASISAKGGYILDGFGGLHPINGASAAAGAYWPGWDIARAIAVRPDGASGYVLDGWGGIHPFGGAPTVTADAVWFGWDIARDIVLRPDGQSGFVLDGFGGVHPFGVSGDIPPVPSATGYWSGWDIAHRAVLNATGDGGYVLDGFGGLHAFGSQPPATSVTAFWSGWDIARDVAFLPGSSTEGWVLDGWGGLHPFGGAPAVTATATPGRDDWRALALA